MSVIKFIIIVIILIPVLVISSVVSCMKWDADYSERYTYEYITANYVFADPNLVYMHGAENCIGPFDKKNGGNASYYAIKDIPIEEYLILYETMLLTYPKCSIIKGKQSDLPQCEVLSLDIKRVELILNDTVDSYDTRLGEKSVFRRIGKLKGKDADAVQAYMRECIDTENYYKYSECKDAKGAQLYGHILGVRIVFEEYKNIEWSSYIFEMNGEYFMRFYRHVADGEYQGDTFETLLVPLNDDLSSMLKEELEK